MQSEWNYVHPHESNQDGVEVDSSKWYQAHLEETDLIWTNSGEAWLIQVIAGGAEWSWGRLTNVWSSLSASESIFANRIQPGQNILDLS